VKDYIRKVIYNGFLKPGDVLHGKPGSIIGIVSHRKKETKSYKNIEQNGNL
jgi:hypothetical protein